MQLYVIGGSGTMREAASIYEVILSISEAYMSITLCTPWRDHLKSGLVTATETLV